MALRAPAFVVRGLEAVTGIWQQAKQTQEAKVAVQTSIDDVRQAGKDGTGTEDPRKIDRAVDTISDKSSVLLKRKRREMILLARRH